MPIRLSGRQACARAGRGPRRRCPRCTPSAPTAAASSTSSLIRSERPCSRHRLARAVASSRRRRASSDLSRYCTRRAPPRRAAATVGRDGRDPEPPVFGDDVKAVQPLVHGATPWQPLVQHPALVAWSSACQVNSCAAADRAGRIVAKRQAGGTGARQSAAGTMIALGKTGPAECLWRIIRPEQLVCHLVARGLVGAGDEHRIVPACRSKCAA